MSSNGAVLIAEDDADVSRAASVALSSHVERVDAVDSIAALEAVLRPNAFDVVLLDMNFTRGARNGADGLAALDTILRVDAALAVVVMTAYGGVSLAVESLKRGAADFILKPWRNETLAEAVLAGINVTRSKRGSETLDLETLERRAIERALARYCGNISSTAASLGLSRAALYRRMSKHGL